MLLLLRPAIWSAWSGNMQRRYVLISLLFAMTVIAVYDACAAQGGTIGSLLGMITRASLTGLVIVAFLGGSLLLQHWMTSRETPARVKRPAGPGRFKVIGTDQETLMQTVEFINADSPDHAATKVNLKGVNVDDVQRA
jgi:hypothetical protein